MDGRLQVIKLHDCLHGFRAGRGTRTATIEVKLAQQLAYLEQVPLFGTFLDLWKEYDALYCKQLMLILVGYSVRPKIRALIGAFWEYATLVCKAGGCFGKPF